MRPRDQFRHCPGCGAAVTVGACPLRCGGCGFTFYFNPTLAAAAFVFDPAGRVILVRRERDPGKGLLTVPGGFVDIGETAEAALHREIMEEVGLTVANTRYVCSVTNEYLYRGVTYPVCDLMFRADAVDPEAAMAGDGATAFEWRELRSIAPAELAFPSVKRGLEILRVADL